MAEQHLQVEGLDDAFRRVVAYPVGHQRTVVVKHVRPRDASTMAEMVKVAGMQDGIAGGWTLGNGKRIKRMITAEALLHLLKEVVLPSLLVDGNNPSLIQALLTYGQFHDRALIVSDHLLAHADDAGANPPSRRSVRALRASVRELIREITDLEAGEATIAQANTRRTCGRRNRIQCDGI